MRDRTVRTVKHFPVLGDHVLLEEVGVALHLGVAHEARVVLDGAAVVHAEHHAAAQRPATAVRLGAVQ